jgi:hypothetical protein
MKLNLSPLEGYEKQTDRFVKAYDLIDTILPVRSNKKQLKHPKKRSCRFCNHSFPNVKFSKTAHLFPELLGNKLLFSDFECDSCNKKFGVYENELAHFLGLERAINGVRVKEKTPKFKSADGLIKVETAISDSSQVAIVSREKTGNEAITYNKEDDKIEISFRKPAYSPNKVYKALLKIALSLLPQNEIANDYKIALDYLMGRNPNKLNGCFISGYRLPIGYNFPIHSFIFKKRDSKFQVPTHVMALYYQSTVLAIPIPLNRSDFSFLGKEIEMPLYPPLFSQLTYTKGLEVLPFQGDLSSEEKIREYDSLYFLLQKDEMANSYKKDLKTGIIEKADFNPGEIMQIIIGE